MTCHKAILGDGGQAWSMTPLRSAMELCVGLVPLGGWGGVLWTQGDGSTLTDTWHALNGCLVGGYVALLLALLLHDRVDA